MAKKSSDESYFTLGREDEFYEKAIDDDTSEIYCKKDDSLFCVRRKDHETMDRTEKELKALFKGIADE